MNMHPMCGSRSAAQVVERVADKAPLSHRAPSRMSPSPASRNVVRMSCLRLCYETVRSSGKQEHLGFRLSKVNQCGQDIAECSILRFPKPEIKFLVEGVQ
jgi:hypothetical protein